MALGKGDGRRAIDHLQEEMRARLFYQYAYLQCQFGRWLCLYETLLWERSDKEVGQNCSSVLSV